MKAFQQIFPVAGLVLIGASAFGQAASSPAERTSGAGMEEEALAELKKLMLEKVVVTARRREEKAQTVPIAMTVLSQQKLQDNNITTVADLQHLVPSMSGVSGISRDAFSPAIRGQTDSNGRPGVIMYLNEVPIPAETDGAGLSAGPGLFFDLENIQVLKGPQGTLFGRESVGGAILLATARPKDEFGGRIQLGYGNHDSREIDAAINAPIVDGKLLTRVAFNGQKREGFTWLQAELNHPNGIDIDDRDYWSVRGTVTFRPAQWLENDTIASYQHYESNGSVSFLTDVNVPLANTLAGNFPSVGFPQLAGFLAQQQALGIRTHIPIDNELESGGALLTFSNVTNIELAHDLKLRTILGFDRAVTRRAFNGDATPLPLGNQPRTPRTYPIRQYTAEAQLLGQSFGKRLDWIAGAFYLENPFEDYVLQTGTLLGFSNDMKVRGHNNSKALFAQGSYDLSVLANGLKVNAGLRYTADIGTNDIISGGFGTNCTSVPTVRCDESSARRTHYESSALTWTGGLDYQVKPDTLLYLTSRRGYRAGGVNANVAGTVAPAYGPEYVLDYELGIKSDWTVAKRPLRTNAAIFYQDYTDIQVLRSVLVSNAFLNFTDNAAKARLHGGEIEVLLQLTDNLELGANADFLKYRFTKFATGVSAATIADLRSKEESSPSRKYGVSARYRVPLDPRVGELSLQAIWNWQADFTTGLASLGVMDIPAYRLLNVEAHWNHIGGRPIDVSFFMSNATNSEYLVRGGAVFNALAYNTSMYGEPRMYGIRLRHRFGAE